MKQEDFMPFLKKFYDLIQAGKLCLIGSEGEEQYIAEVSKSGDGYVVNILLQVVPAEGREMLRSLEKNMGKILSTEF